ncbi:MAG TPA: cohesin domain-containing protein [Patescibacteria group bacterium]|nr:cohesin domain-containing protein [Patescibacteria group bacterium]
MPRKTLALILILLALTILLVVVSLTTKQGVPTQAPVHPTATPTPLPPGHTSLMFSPSPVTLTKNQQTQVNVMIDTGGDEVRSVELEIAYDPKVLTGMTIKPGTFFPNPTVLPVGGVNTTTGRITYAITPSAFKDSAKGKGIVATLSFYPVLNASSPSTQISILSKSLVSGNVRGQNVLVKSSGTQVTLTSSTLQSQQPVVLPTVPATSPTP